MGDDKTAFRNAVGILASYLIDGATGECRSCGAKAGENHLCACAAGSALEYSGRGGHTTAGCAPVTVRRLGELCFRAYTPVARAGRKDRFCRVCGARYGKLGETPHAVYCIVGRIEAYVVQRSNRKVQS